MSKQPLYRIANRVDHVVIVGNGIVENGWKPLDNVLENMTPNGDNKNHYDYYVRHCYDKAMFLSLLSFKFKARRLELYKNLKENTWDGNFPGAINTYLEFKNTLAKQYKEFTENNILKLKIDLKSNDFFSLDDTFITINWDDLLWKQENIKNIVQLHGGCWEPWSMILPTELVIDELPFDPEAVAKNSHLQEDGPKLRKILEIFKWDSIHPFVQVHDKANEILGNAKKVTFLGIGMHAYDCELLAQISAYLKPPILREAMVVNIDQKVRGKVIAMTGLNPDNVKWHNPNNFMTKIKQKFRKFRRYTK